MPHQPNSAFSPFSSFAGVRVTHASCFGSVTAMVAVCVTGLPPLLTVAVTVSVPLFCARVRMSFPGAISWITAKGDAFHSVFKSPAPFASIAFIPRSTRLRGNRHALALQHVDAFVRD